MEYSLDDNDVLVSVIMPCHNSVRFIGEAIESVIAQTYPHWELLVVDDYSNDATVQVIDNYCQRDPRIKFFQLDKNSGSAAKPRNVGIENATGNYIAFLDSDDIWLPTKLEEQIELFQEEKVAIVFSNYEKVSSAGKRDNRIIIAPSEVTYAQLLKGNCMGCLTVMYDVSKCDKKYFKEIGHEDYALWLHILKIRFTARNTNTVNALYRVHATSLSANKLKVIFWTWNIYRRQEQLDYFKSIFYFTHYLVKAVFKSLH